jgi:DNA-binding GntR family transcriptional regulator
MALRGNILFVTIDTNSYEPAYIQLAGILRAWIDSGDLPPGAAVPSEASLTQQFGIARETARRAVALLRAEGLIVTMRAVGSFVRLPGQCEPVTAGAGTTIQSRMPTTGERRSLKIPEGVPVLVITRPNGQQELAPADRVTIVVVSEPSVSSMPSGEAAPAAALTRGPSLPADGKG